MTGTRPIRYGTRARVGVLLPSGNIAAEPDLLALLPDDVSMHVSRLRLNGSSEADLMGMTEGVEEAAGLLGHTRPDLVAFHCTAVSTHSEALETQILSKMSAAAAVPVLATSGAIKEALKALDARRVAIISPYIESINRSEAAFLERHGFTCVGTFGLGLERPGEMFAVPPERWLEVVTQRVSDEADTVLLSCTAIRALPAIEACEQALGRPVVTSNQAMGWLLRRRLGMDEDLPGFGRLLRRQRLLNKLTPSCSTTSTHA